MAIPIGSRMVKRPITERTIRALATPESFARGRSYFDDSAVSDLVRRGDRLTAEVEGSELAPYRVSIRLHDGGVAEARCSCPYDFGGYCKHIVAVLLKFADEGTRVIERKTLAKLLRELDQSRLIELLEKRAESDSELAAWIEAELATTVEPSSLRNKEVGRRRTPVDPEPVREHTRNLLAKRQRRGRYWDGYRASGDLEELQRLVEKAVPFIEVGDGSNALRILEPIAEAFVDDWLEHSFGSDEHLYELFADLGRLMAEAALMSDLSADERDALAQTLEDWQARLEEYGVDEGFHVAIRALQTAWDDPVLAAVMAGKGKAWPPSGQEDEHIYRFHCGERAAGDAEASAGAPASARGVADAVLTVGQYSAVAAGGVNSLNPRMRWLCSPTRSRTRAALAGPAPGRSWITRNPERSHRFAGIQPNSGQGDHSRLSCSAGDTQLGLGSAGIFS